MTVNAFVGDRAEASIHLSLDDAEALVGTLVKHIQLARASELEADVSYAWDVELSK